MTLNDKKKEESFFDNTLYRKAAKEKLLTREEESDLIHRAQTGERAALDRIIRTNVRLVFAVAGKYACRGLDYDDLVQQGMLGLIRSVETFDLDRGVRLSTYATYWVRHMIKRAVDDQSGYIRIPVHMSTKCARAIKQLRKDSLCSGNELIAADIAEHLGIDELEAAVVLHCRSGKNLSLDQEIEAATTVTHKDMVADDSLTQDDRVNSAMATTRASEIIALVMKTLDRRENDIVRRRLIEDPPDTLVEIGKDYDVSRERVRQIQGIALEKMRRSIVFLGLAEECADLLELFEDVSDRPGYGDCVERASRISEPPTGTDN